MDDGNNNSMQDLTALMETVYTKCREEVIKECQAKVDPKILIQFELGYERQKQLLGLGGRKSLGGEHSRGGCQDLRAELLDSPAGLAISLGMEPFAASSSLGQFQAAA